MLAKLESDNFDRNQAIFFRFLLLILSQWKQMYYFDLFYITTFQSFSFIFKFESEISWCFFLVFRHVHSSTSRIFLFILVYFEQQKVKCDNIVSTSQENTQTILVFPLNNYAFR